MRYFFDTEFIERGSEYPLLLISIGIVAEDGREFYAETMQSLDYYPEDCNDWVRANVLPHLQWQTSGWGLQVNIEAGATQMLGHPGDIAAEIVEFVGNDDEPRFYAYYADYDWVIFCQLFGTMIDLPRGWPMYCRDIKQIADMLGVVLPVQQGLEHHALADARWVRESFDYLQDRQPDWVHP